MDAILALTFTKDVQIITATYRMMVMRTSDFSNSMLSCSDVDLCVQWWDVVRRLPRRRWPSARSPSSFDRNRCPRCTFHLTVFKFSCRDVVRCTELVIWRLRVKLHQDMYLDVCVSGFDLGFLHQFGGFRVNEIYLIFSLNTGLFNFLIFIQLFI